MLLTRRNIQIVIMEKVEVYQGMYDILFVDDDETIGFIVSNYKIWGDSDYRISSIAGNGKQAAELLEKNSYDLLITDIRMPVMDGLDLMRFIHDRKITICTVLASTYNDFEYAKEGMRLGAIEYIEKPFTEEKLNQALVYATQFFEERKEKALKPLELECLISEELKKECLNCIVNNRDTRLEVLRSWLDDLLGRSNITPDSTSLLLTKLLQEVWNEMIESYPWVGYMERMNIRITADNYEEQYQRIIIEFITLVERYQLGKPDQIINRACKIIYNHCLEDDVMEQLVNELELSKDYIGKLFRCNVGMTLNEYLTTLKMEKGKRILENTNMKVYEISERLGYITVDYFTRLFRKYTGYTPLQYKKTVSPTK